ncbi:cuticle protein-like [Bactrocera tryoni]|uniref:cuticle protein-like n=1 Tax=Bactrocera tryoni TaxID=59916 RepID=UPI001A9794B2|nr:cuticle protein-like [Bactrocera tryoni]
MAFKFVLLICVAAATQGIVTAEFNYNPDLYNGNNSNNNQNNGVYNINSYNDNVKQPANSYNAPLAALNAFNGNAPAPSQQQQQQQQPNSNGYNYNPNNYNNNAAQQQPENQQGQSARQSNYDFNNGAAQKQLPNSVPTPAGYDYSPQNFAGLTSSSSASASASESDATFTKLETSFNSQAHHRAAPTAAPVEEYNPPAKYDYSYNVHDDETGDIKSHAEARDGYFVQGSYSVVDPDGFQRTVTYTVDGPSGFNAVVNRVPYAIKAARTITLSAPASSVAPVSKLAELPLSNDISLTESSAVSASSSSAAEQKAIDTVGTELPVQPHDSYLAPPVDSRDGKGPYP